MEIIYETWSYRLERKRGGTTGKKLIPTSCTQKSIAGVNPKLERQNCLEKKFRIVSKGLQLQSTQEIYGQRNSIKKMVETFGHIKNFYSLKFNIFKM